MRIHTKLVYEWSDAAQAYIEVYEEGFDICPENGQVALCKGATSEQTDLAKAQSDFYSTLTNDYSTQFANQSNILSALQQSLQPIVSAGINQYGYSKGEENTLNSQAIQSTGQQYQNAQKSLQNSQAAAGGGDQYLPSGVNQQTSAQLAASGANTTSNELLNVKQQGYEQGRQNYLNAISSLSGVASQYSPTSYANSATSAGSLADQQASTVQKADAASSPWSTIGGLLGGVLGSATGSSLGGSLISSLSGLGKSSSGGTNIDGSTNG